MSGHLMGGSRYLEFSRRQLVQIKSRSSLMGGNGEWNATDFAGMIAISSFGKAGRAMAIEQNP